MTRKCSVTGKKSMVGNNVSHANNKTKRTFLPNIQEKSLHSDVLGRMIRLKLSTNALRTIERHGGLDAYLLQADASRLAPKVARLKKVIEARKAAQS